MRGIGNIVTGLLVAAALLAPRTALAETAPTSSASGFFVNSGGWIATSAHVIDGCDRVSVIGLGDADKRLEDTRNDIAAIHVAAAGRHFLNFRTAPPRLAEDVAAFGFPLSGLLSDSIKVTTGNVSALSGIGNDTHLLQVSTPLQPGNSGGPIVDRQGFVLGIAKAILAPKVAEQLGVIPQNVNFAVRPEAVTTFLDAHDIPYTRASNDGGQELSTADMADRVAPAVVQILCYGGSTAPGEIGEQTDPGDPSSYVEADGYDAIAYDYRSASHVSAGQCRSLCAGEPACRAATYNKPARYCFLKSNARLLVHNADATAFLAPDVAERRRRLHLHRRLELRQSRRRLPAHAQCRIRRLLSRLRTGRRLPRLLLCAAHKRLLAEEQGQPDRRKARRRSRHALAPRGSNVTAAAAGNAGLSAPNHYIPVKCPISPMTRRVSAARPASRRARRPMARAAVLPRAPWPRASRTRPTTWPASTPSSGSRSRPPRARFWCWPVPAPARRAC